MRRVLLDQLKLWAKLAYGSCYPSFYVEPEVGFDSIWQIKLSAWNALEFGVGCRVRQRLLEDREADRLDPARIGVDHGLCRLSGERSQRTGWRFEPD